MWVNTLVYQHSGEIETRSIRAFKGLNHQETDRLENVLPQQCGKRNSNQLGNNDQPNIYKDNIQVTVNMVHRGG